MTEIHTYYCDICGQTFDFEGDCREHEIEHNVAKLKGEVVMMDETSIPSETLWSMFEKLS